MAFSEAVGNTILAKCGRCCCLCRRFKPTLLQVHHIIEESAGGSDEESNGIALCINCHIDVHSRVPFTRRFTREELVAHRNAVFALVAAGKLPADGEEPGTTLFFTRGRRASQAVDLSPIAQQILVEAARAERPIFLAKHLGGTAFQAGNLNKDLGQGRVLAEVESALNELVQHGLVTTSGHKREVFSVTLRGYELADVLMSMAGQITAQ